MPRADRDFSDTSPEENVLLAFDYKSGLFRLAPDEIISSAVVSMTVAAEHCDDDAVIDTNPSSRIEGPAIVTANEKGIAGMAVVQRIKTCVAGNKYIVSCLALTSQGQKLVLWAYIMCRAVGDEGP